MANRVQRLTMIPVVALVLVAAAQGRGTALPYGTWLGTPRFPGKQEPGVVYTPIKLVAGPAWVQVESTGPTTASHDAPGAKSTCATRYRFSSTLSADGWRLYTQEGKPKLSGSVSGGPPTSGVCGSTPSGGYRDAVRLRLAGTKLRVEFGATRPAGKAVGPSDFDSHYKSGYLHR
jgi:hypothetical protein